MSPVYSLAHLRADLHARLAATSDPVLAFALKNQIQNLVKLDNRARVVISLARDNANATRLRTANLTSAALVKPDKQTHWSYDDKTASAAKRAERSRQAYVTFFNVQPDANTLTAINTLGGWKKALTALNLSYFLDITPEALTEDRETFLTIFTKKLTAHIKTSV